MRYKRSIVVGEGELSVSKAMTFRVGPYSVRLMMHRGLMVDGTIIVTAKCHHAESGRIAGHAMSFGVEGPYEFSPWWGDSITLNMAVETYLIEA